ncbi:MAG: hypothetical protein FD129_2943 [bacterium]|nr:MAG: hypothetical protein FD129_2943 [bacterium]
MGRQGGRLLFSLAWGFSEMDLPESWRFLAPGWWAIHLLGIGIIYLLGMGHGRRQALRMMDRSGGIRPGSTPTDADGQRHGEG